MFPGATYKDVALGPDQIRMAGKFNANGASAVSASYGKGFTVARTGTGEYTVSLGTSAFPTPYKRLISANVSALVANGTFAHPLLKTDTSSSATAPLIILKNVDTSGNPADVTATIYFEFVFGTSELNS